MTSKITYIGDFRCESTHLQSNSIVETDAPTDNHGKGERFSPTDLLATSLGQCMLTTIAILGESRGVDINGATCEITKIMSSNPRKVAEIQCHLIFPLNYEDKDKLFIEKTALSCPVALSLSETLVKTVTFSFGN